MRIASNAALVIIDAQRGFDRSALWRRGNHPDAEANMLALARFWEDTGRPIVCVRHRSERVTSVFASWSPDRRLKPELDGIHFDLEIEKSVNSAFLGTPDLHAWLQAHEIDHLFLVGIQTNMCVETTARVAGNLGYRVTVPLDATRTFEIRYRATALSADQLSMVTAANLAAGGFAEVVSTSDVLGNFVSGPHESPAHTDHEHGRISGEY